MVLYNVEMWFFGLCICLLCFSFKWFKLLWILVSGFFINELVKCYEVKGIILLWLILINSFWYLLVKELVWVFCVVVDIVCYVFVILVLLVLKFNLVRKVYSFVEGILCSSVVSSR